MKTLLLSALLVVPTQYPPIPDSTTPAVATRPNRPIAPEPTVPVGYAEPVSTTRDLPLPAVPAQTVVTRVTFTG